jgi:hypothetical protein
MATEESSFPRSIPLFITTPDLPYPETATEQERFQFCSMGHKVCQAVLQELFHAYFGTMVDTGQRLTPFQLGEIAASVGRAAVLQAFVGGDARDA